MDFDYVRLVYDFYVWMVLSDLLVFSVYIVVEDFCFVDGYVFIFLVQIQQCLLGYFDFDYLMLQLELFWYVGIEN